MRTVVIPRAACVRVLVVLLCAACWVRCGDPSDDAASPSVATESREPIGTAAAVAEVADESAQLIAAAPEDTLSIDGDGKSWVISVLDYGNGRDFTTPTVACDSFGNPHVAYADSLSSTIWHAWWDGVWHRESLTTDLARLPGIAVDASDHPGIAFVSRVSPAGSDTPHYAFFNGSGWTVEETSAASVAANNVALRFRDTVPYFVIGGDAALAYKSGGTWSAANVSGLLAVGQRDLLFRAGNTWPDISGANGSYLYWISYSGGWTSTSVIGETGVGYHNAIAQATDGTLRFSTSFPDGNLYYADVNIASGVTATATTNDLRIDALDNPQIMFYDTYTTTLRLASRSSGGIWSVSTIDGNPGVGRYLDFDIFKFGPQHVVYTDATNHAVKYAKSDCTGMVAAAFTADRIDLCAGDTVQFTDQSTGTISRWDWNFGNGGTSHLRNPARVYSSPGTATVSLAVRGCGFDKVIKTDYLTIRPAPVADFTGSPLAVNYGESVQFQDASSGTFSSRLWSFGDGQTSTAINPLHAYTTCGSKTVALTLSGMCGDVTKTRAGYVTVANCPCVDADGDGYGAGEGMLCPHPEVDCNDADPAVHPGATEVCNGLDDNCNGSTDEGGIALCDDGNVCTTDTCGGGAGCIRVNNTAACNDGVYCNGADMCSGGVCVHAGSPCDAWCQTCNEGADRCDNRAGSCDDGIYCNGTDTCAGGVCTHAGAPCDAQCQTCNEGADRCDNRAGSCDDGVYCDGTDTCANGACATHSGNPCAEDNDVCNGVTSCNETGDRCDTTTPLNCDDGNPCTIDSCDAAGGCLHVAGNAGTVCRAAAGPCDVAETCTGTSTACPADAFRPSSFECRSAAGACDAAEFCGGSSATCPADVYQPSSATCRPAAGACDISENCTGSSIHCPGDLFRPDTYQCRAAAGSCDVVENCTGTSAPCPNDAFLPGSLVCRPAIDLCDAAETCPGDAADCPVDDVEPEGFTCRAAAGLCDAPETCDGLTTSCPIDAVREGGFTCRAPVGACDAAEVCDGFSMTCPDDVLQPVDTECRPAIGVCDVSEQCAGTSVDCPDDRSAENGTGCDDGLFCNGTDSCQDGACAHAGDPCSAGESCDEPEQRCDPAADDDSAADDDAGDDTGSDAQRDEPDHVTTYCGS